jgi:hypothetical protein
MISSPLIPSMFVNPREESEIRRWTTTISSQGEFVINNQRIGIPVLIEDDRQVMSKDQGQSSRRSDLDVPHGGADFLNTAILAIRVAQWKKWLSFSWDRRTSV